MSPGIIREYNAASGTPGQQLHPRSDLLQVRDGTAVFRSGVEVGVDRHKVELRTAVSCGFQNLLKFAIVLRRYNATHFEAVDGDLLAGDIGVFSIGEDNDTVTSRHSSQFLSRPIQGSVEIGSMTDQGVWNAEWFLFIIPIQVRLNLGTECRENIFVFRPQMIAETGGRGYQQIRSRPRAVAAIEQDDDAVRRLHTSKVLDAAGLSVIEYFEVVLEKVRHRHSLVIGDGE